jgi:hypothetical protein
MSSTFLSSVGAFRFITKYQVHFFQILGRFVLWRNIKHFSSTYWVISFYHEMSSKLSNTGEFRFITKCLNQSRLTAMMTHTNDCTWTHPSAQRCRDSVLRFHCFGILGGVRFMGRRWSHTASAVTLLSFVCHDDTEVGSTKLESAHWRMHKLKHSWKVMESGLWTSDLQSKVPAKQSGFNDVWVVICSEAPRRHVLRL